MDLSQCGYPPFGLNQMGLEKCEHDLCNGFRPRDLYRKLLDHSNGHRIDYRLACLLRCR